MKTTDPRDPLDQKIDELLASQPAKARADFAAQILAEIDAEPQKKKAGPLAPLIRFALPLAAAVALAFVVYSQFSHNNLETANQIAKAPTNNLAMPGTETSEALSNYEIQEILILQEGLSSFAQIESDELNSSELLETLDTLYSI